MSRAIMRTSLAASNSFAGFFYFRILFSFSKFSETKMNADVLFIQEKVYTIRIWP
jgi:hypothetical protein